MTNGTKLIIGILVIAAIGIGISTAIETEESKGKSNTAKNNTSSMLQYMEDAGKKETKKNNTVENDKVVENKVEEKVEEEVVGKEEEDSKQENVGLNKKEKAIKLAQDEWAISINSYDFQAELQNDGTYKVTVRSNDSNRTTVAIYIVNVENETVTEI